MQQQLLFENLPTEALFGFFCSSGPELLGTYSLVCKKWSQMSKDNELWRQYCMERWDKNPKESDCVKNWLIPVREGGISKENRINWKRCYLLRSLSDRATKFLQLHVPEKKTRLGFLNRKKKQENDSDLFSKGWPTIDDLARFERKVSTTLTQLIESEEYDLDSIHMYKPLMDLFIEFELLILRQINISRIKYLGLATKYLEYVAPILREFPDYVPRRLASFASQYFELVAEKDIPTDISTSFYEKIAVLFIDLISNVELPLDFSVHLTKFIRIIIANISNVLKASTKQWANDEVDERPASPPQIFEAMLHSISLALANKQAVGMQLFLIATQLELQSEQAPNPILPIAVLSSIASGFSYHIATNAKQFMEIEILPFWKPSTDVEYLVPAIYYFSQILSEVGETIIQTQYVSEILKPLLTMAKHDNHNVQREVAGFVVGYCTNLNDGDVLLPYLNELLDIMYGYSKSKNTTIRKEAIIAISSLILSCPSEFAQQKDRMMTEFKNLLANGSASDRGSVIEALTRIGAGIGDQKSSIEADIELLYDQMVEDCKRDRDAHIDLLLKMTPFGILALGSKFSKYMDYVFPLIIENARLSTIEYKAPYGNTDADANQMEEENDDEGSEHMADPSQFHISHQAIDRKESSLTSLHHFIASVDRKTLLTVHEEISAALQHSISTHAENTLKLQGLAREVFTEFVLKLFVKDDPEWCKTDRMWMCWLNCVNLLLMTLEDVNVIQHKPQYIFSIAKIFNHFCEISTPEQPFLTLQVMKHLGETVFEQLSAQYYEAEEEKVPFEEIYDIGSEIIDFLEIICKTRQNKDLFWEFADNMLVAIFLFFQNNGITQYRWFEACLITTVFDHFGTEFLENNRINFLKLVELCMNVPSAEMYQCIANNIGVMARKYAEFLPHNHTIDNMFNYVVHLLIGDNCQRDAAPSAYDNALMALSGLLLFLASGKSLDPQVVKMLTERLVKYMTYLTLALPPAVGGDKIEGSICIDQYCQLLTKTQVFFEGEDGAALKIDVIRALTETLELPDYNNAEIHAMIDPVLQKLVA